MRQETLGSVLGELYRHSMTSRVNVAQQQTGDANAPPFAVVEREVPCLIEQMSSRDRQARQTEYSLPVTHFAYMEQDTLAAMGAKLIEIDVADEQGGWQRVRSGQQQTFVVRGKQRMPQVPGSPAHHYRLDLWQETATR